MNTAANAGQGANKAAKETAQDVKHVVEETIEIHAAKNVGKVRGFLSGMSKSMVASLAGFAGIAVGAGAAVMVKNHMDKKAAQEHLHSSNPEVLDHDTATM